MRAPSYLENHVDPTILHPTRVPPLAWRINTSSRVVQPSGCLVQCLNLSREYPLPPLDEPPPDELLPEPTTSRLPGSSTPDCATPPWWEQVPRPSDADHVPSRQMLPALADGATSVNAPKTMLAARAAWSVSLIRKRHHLCHDQDACLQRREMDSYLYVLV